MHPIILFFEDHRDPIAKDLLSTHLKDLQTLQFNTLALEIDKDMSIDTHLAALFKFCGSWSALKASATEKLLQSVSQATQREFYHNISCIPAKKAEANLILNVKRLEQPMTCRGFDLNLGDIRLLPPEQQLSAAYALQTEREFAMQQRLTELSNTDGVVAILGLSHFGVATRLKEQGHDVFCFLPVSITPEAGVCHQFLEKIEQHDAAVADLVLLDQRVHSTEELWQVIASTIQPAPITAARMG